MEFCGKFCRIVLQFVLQFFLSEMRNYIQFHKLFLMFVLEFNIMCLGYAMLERMIIVNAEL